MERFKPTKYIDYFYKHNTDKDITDTLGRAKRGYNAHGIKNTIWLNYAKRKKIKF